MRDRPRADAQCRGRPFSDESAGRKGYRSIKAGREDVRRALFNGARVAIPHNPIANDFYERLRARGEGYKVALVATRARRRAFAAGAKLKKPAPRRPLRSQCLTRLSAP